MLGFAALVENEGDELNELSPIFMDEDSRTSPASSLLDFRFTNFHRCLNHARLSMQDLGIGTAIVFSDSAFFVIDAFAKAFPFARALMLELVSSDVPARMGIAQGSYRMLRFLTDSSAQVSFHMSQFLGTGIVRAYQAERCGVPGLRILLHPVLEPLIHGRPSEIVSIPPNETAGARPQVTRELNYLEDTPSNLGPDYDDCIQFDSLLRMAVEAADAYWYHYAATFNAWNSMRAQLGREPYPYDKFVNRDDYDKKHGVHERLKRRMGG